MKLTGFLALLAATCWIVLVLVPAGCGESGKAIEIRYDRPAAYDIPKRVKRVAIAEFGGRKAQDRQWGDIASDKLAAGLEEYNRRYHRYQLVDRKRLKAILDERDLQIAIGDSATAAKAGKLAKVQAMIYGTVHVMTRDERGLRTVPDPLRRTTKTVPFIKRYCQVTVNFTMDDIRTSKTLATVTATRDFDSEKVKKSGLGSIGKFMGFGGGKLPATDEIVNRLIEQCVQQFLSKISPHSMVFKAKLRRGKSKIVSTGNKLAHAAEYAEALECYQSAAVQRGDDHGAMFNAGVVLEAMGKLKQAEAYYDKAFKLKAEQDYILARRRVRSEQKEQTPGPPAATSRASG